MLNGKMLILFVGNGFIRSTPPNATQRTAVIIEPFGTDKSVPYAKHNISRFNEPRRLTDVSERINPFPTHTLEHIPLGELVKHQFADLRYETIREEMKMLQLGIRLHDVNTLCAPEEKTMEARVEKAKLEGFSCVHLAYQ